MTFFLKINNFKKFKHFSLHGLYSLLLIKLTLWSSHTFFLLLSVVLLWIWYVCKLWNIMLQIFLQLLNSTSFGIILILARNVNQRSLQTIHWKNHKFVSQHSEIKQYNDSNICLLSIDYINSIYNHINFVLFILSYDHNLQYFLLETAIYFQFTAKNLNNGSFFALGCRQLVHLMISAKDAIK